MPASVPAEIIASHTPELFETAVARAAAALIAGEIIALPTETVYGLAANALNTEAVRRVFQAKGRPSNNPLIVHVASLAMARQCATEWPEAAERLARAFWPGPLTLVLNRASSFPAEITAGGATVGIRWPSHPLIQAVIRRCGFPLAAPSANPSNRTSPTQAGHVVKLLGDKIKWVVDGGQSQVGIESAVIDVTQTPARILRPGSIHIESLQAALGELSIAPAAGLSDAAAKTIHASPGQGPVHYAPRAKLSVLAWKHDSDLHRQLAQIGIAASQAHVIAHTHIPDPTPFGRVSVVPHDAEAYARAFYAELHRCDEEEAKTIVIEALPEGCEWAGIADRLRRAMGSGNLSKIKTL